MSLQAELETWAAALQAYDQEDFEKSLELFSQIADSPKILTNIGIIYATLGEHEAAVEHFTAATELDQYLAVAYFQCGVSNFLLTRYDAAYDDFSSAVLSLRGNQFINYESLGLKFKLFFAEVLFNRGLTQIHMDHVQEGLADMQDTQREKANEEHGIIDHAIQDRGEGCTVFSIPVGVLYRPTQKKLENPKARDYLRKVHPAAVFLNDGGPAYSLIRPATVAAPSFNLPQPANGDDPKPSPALQRAMTTITVPLDARERSRAAAAEEGYVSGEHEDVLEMVKIRVKLYCREEVRGMMLLPETPYQAFMDMVTRKCGVVPGAFIDEDGGKVTLRDEMDYELAIKTARHNAKGRPDGRLQIWCMDE